MTVSTIQCTSRTTLLVLYNIVSYSLGTTNFTCNFSFSDYQKHFNNSSLTEYSEISVKSEAT